MKPGYFRDRSRVSDTPRLTSSRLTIGLTLVTYGPSAQPFGAILRGSGYEEESITFLFVQRRFLHVKIRVKSFASYQLELISPINRLI